MAKKPEETSADGAAAPKTKGKKKLIIIAGVLVLALGGGGAGAWYFMRPSDPNAPKAAEAEKPSQFLPLESFTVNLAAADGQPQYLQAGLTLKLRHDVKIDVLKERMPEIRNRILLVLSGKKSNELLPVSGKQKLATELSDTIRDVIGDTAGTKHAAKPAAKPQAETEKAADGEKEASEKDSETAKAEGEGKAERKEKAKPAPAAHVVKNDVEVLFTSFIIQ